MSADPRPQNCRFRLKDEGKVYPRSACSGCKKTIMTGLGLGCTITEPFMRDNYPDGPDLAPAPVTVPMDPGDFIGDIYYGDPIKTTMGTHRWNGKEWVSLPTEAEALCELLAKARSAPAPVVVDWQARAEALRDALDDLTGTLNYLRTQAQNGTLHPQVVIQNVDMALSALVAAAKEPRHE